jgi:hypothetical protein
MMKIMRYILCDTNKKSKDEIKLHVFIDKDELKRKILACKNTDDFDEIIDNYDIFTLDINDLFLEFLKIYNYEMTRYMAYHDLLGDSLYMSTVIREAVISGNFSEEQIDHCLSLDEYSLEYFN